MEPSAFPVAVRGRHLSRRHLRLCVLLSGESFLLAHNFPRTVMRFRGNDGSLMAFNLSPASMLCGLLVITVASARSGAGQR
jgi:hypothetical protein